MENFTVEVMDFYPDEPRKKKSCFVGTIKTRIPEIGLILMGIRVLKINGHFKYEMPNSKTICHKTHKDIRYPHICFELPINKEKFIRFLIEQAPAIIERDILKYAETPRKPPTDQQEKKDQKLKKNDSVKPEIVPNKARSISFDKEYIDLPPLKNKRSSK